MTNTAYLANLHRVHPSAAAAGFWRDLDTRSRGTITYKLVTAGATDLATAQTLLGLSGVPEWMLLATWDTVP